MSERIASALRDGIADGTYQPGTLLPSVRTLAAGHGVSDEPVRRALRALAGEGLVVSEPGRGVRVTPTAAATPTPVTVEERIAQLERRVADHVANGHRHP